MEGQDLDTPTLDQQIARRVKALRAERGWSLSDRGRYAHHPSYLRRVLHDAGLRQVEMIEDQLHLELGEPVMAWVVTATRPAPRGG